MMVGTLQIIQLVLNPVECSTNMDQLPLLIAYALRQNGNAGKGILVLILVALADQLAAARFGSHRVRVEQPPPLGLRR